jgi:hypothetical protein
MFLKVDTASAPAVAAVVRTIFLRVHPGADPGIIDRLFRDVEDMFNGRHLDYLPLDMRYHNVEHTLQAVLALAQLIEGRHRAGVAPALDARYFEVALAAVLLHDTGYLKLRSDSKGTGAKYSFVHVIRSCAFAASHLPTVGFKVEEIDSVVAAIQCTGPRSKINQLHFSGEIEHFIGCAVTTADYLGQMAAPHYIDDLASLYAELEECNDFFNVPRDRRLFHSVQELITKTPAFWEQFVLPRLTRDCHAVYRYLADPYPGGPNAYLQAVEQNIHRALARATQDLPVPASSSSRE